MNPRAVTLEDILRAKFERNLRNHRTASKELACIESDLDGLRSQKLPKNCSNFILSHQMQLVASDAWRDQRVAVKNAELFTARVKIETSYVDLRASYEKFLTYRNLVTKTLR